ncbi:MAG: HlyD family efflux transporter periplasmic adaptor subunit [Vicinamibacterales bacterium]|nr:HlyD family efflux transporter periplasmic adaptor subunit [Vicinamibacterales bacterium]
MHDTPGREPDAAARPSWDHAETVAAMPSTVTRGAVYLVALIVLATAALLYFGRVHMVVTGRGRIAPEGDVVLVQAVQGGVVSGVLAKAGDRVPAGAPILKLDVAESGVSLTELQQRADALAEQLALLASTRRVINRILANPADGLRAATATSAATVGAVAQIVNEIENLRGRVEGAKKAAESWPARRGASTREIELMRENIAINEKSAASQKTLLAANEAALVQKQTQLQGFRALAERRLISSLELAAEEEKVRAAEAGLAESRRRLEQSAVDISNQKIKLAELEGRVAAEPMMRDAAVRQAESTLRQQLALLRQEGVNLGIQARDVEATLKATQARLAMAESKVALNSITAPVAGMVAEMKVTSTGEVLAAGALVAVIVPEGVPLVVQAAVPNRDVGFVRPGIEARVKVDAYPFQQFGTLPARVRTVVPGLGTDNSFTVTLDLLSTRLSGGDRDLPLFPGLEVEAELLTGRQRLISRLLAPGSAPRAAK